MNARSIADRVREIADRVAIDHGLELVHSEVAGPDNKPIVRIFIDKPNGVTHQDCSEVSHYLGTILDVEDFIHSAYTLEVSSPGLDRVLRTREHFARFVGERVKIETSAPIDGRKKFSGRLSGVAAETIEIDVDGRIVRVAIDAIHKARLIA